LVELVSNQNIKSPDPAGGPGLAAGLAMAERTGSIQAPGKRVLDVSLALLSLVFLAPLIFGIAIAVKCSSKGPVFFRQTRQGLNGRLFKIWKFRTMYIDRCDPSGLRQAEIADPRITPIGHFLRRSSFDELPQLFNVIAGDMSLVGPRPHVPGMLAAGVPYEDFDPRYGSRHCIRPGMTGLAQVRGYRGATAVAKAAANRLQCDLEYIQRRTLWLDIKILAVTLRQEFLTGRGY